MLDAGGVEQERVEASEAMKLDRAARLHGSSLWRASQGD